MRIKYFSETLTHKEKYKIFKSQGMYATENKNV